MHDAFINAVQHRLIKAGIATSALIRGCTSAEVEEIASLAKEPLPLAYEIFLRAMGRGAGRFLEGTDIFYPEVLAIRKGAEGLLEEDSAPFQLSESDFVFCSHQGYQFLCFNLDESEDDPPVFYYIEGSGALEAKWDHFSSFLLKAVEDLERLPSSNSGM